MKRLILLQLFLFCIVISKSNAAIITATGSGNWNSVTVNAPWPSGIVPLNTDDVVIPATCVVNVTTSPTCNNLTVNNGTLNFNTNTRTLTVNGNLTLGGTGIIAGNAASRVLNVAGTFTLSAGATAQLGNILLSITGTSTFNGGVTIITGSTASKTFTGNATFNNGSSITYNVSNTLTFSGLVTTNGTVTVSGTTAGLATMGSLTVAAASIFNISDWSLTVTGTSTIDGTIRFLNNNGTKTFGAINVSASGTWDCSAVDEQFVNNGNITCTGTFLGSLSNTASTEYAISAVGLAINGTLTIANLRVAGVNSVTNNANLTITNLLNGGGSFIQGTGGFLNIQIPIGGGGFLVTTFDAVTNTPNTTDYNLGAAQIIRNTTYNNLSISNSGVKSLTGNSTVVNGALTIQGTAQLDADVTNNYSFAVKGNWTVTSTNADPFLEQAGGVTLSGTAGTQVVSTPLTQETFYHLTINNTSATSPGLQTTKNISVTNEYDHTAGTFDLNGKNLTVTNTVAANDNLTGGLIMTGVAGSLIDFSDGAGDLADVIFGGTDVGTAANPIPLTITVGRCCLDFLELYGVGNFTKQLNIDDVCGGGGNIFHNTVNFTAEVTASRWRMGDGSAAPDIFYGDVNYNANGKGGANNNFIVGANSLGNEYYGTTTFLSTTIGGFYVGRSNGTGNNSFTFHGPIVITVNDSGNVVLGDAAVANLSTINIESTVQINSNAASVGDVYIGKNNFSTLSMYASGQIIDGNIQGATNVYFNSITQTNALTNTTTSLAVSNSTIYVGTGSGGNGPCTFGGIVILTSPNISLRGSTFNAATNFQANGATGFASYGGNTFNAPATFCNNGTGYWRLANNAGDDYNGNVVFKQAATAGVLDPAYATTCTFSRNISTVATGASVNFGTSSGVVKIDGTTSQFFLGSAALKPIVKRLTMATSGAGTLTLSVPVAIATAGDLTMTSGIIFTTATNILKLTDDNITANIGNATSYVDGPLYSEMSKNGTDTLNLPLGKGNDWRPAVLYLTHNSATAYAYTAELFNASAYGLGYTIPASLDTVSFIHYWQIDRTLVSSGAASQANLTAGSVELYYDTNDGVYSAANLRVAKTITTGTVWNNVGGTGTANTTGSIKSTTNFTSFCTFTLAAATAGIWNPLPIELTRFTASPCGDNVCLNWSTASETNNDFCTIEKTKDGANYEQVAIVDGAGTSTSSLNYSAVDNSPYSGESYYRLKQTDFDGHTSYSSLEKVDFANTDFSFNVFPNPSDGNDVNLAFTSSSVGQEILVVVYDVTGRESYSKIIITQNTGENIYAMDPSSKLAPGLYVVSATSEQSIFNKKLIVK